MLTESAQSNDTQPSNALPSSESDSTARVDDEDQQRQQWQSLVKSYFRQSFAIYQLTRSQRATTFVAITPSRSTFGGTLLNNFDSEASNVQSGNYAWVPTGLERFVQSQIQYHQHDSISECETPVRGWNALDLSFQPNSDERAFHYNVELVLLRRHGCAYSDNALSRPSLLVGACPASILQDNHISLAAKIAVLDSLLSETVPPATLSHQHRGPAADKPSWRAGVVADAAIGDRTGANVLLIGAVGEIIKALQSHGANVSCVDLDHSIVGKMMYDVIVDSAVNTARAISQSDIVLATGMTLSNATFNALHTACRRQNKLIALYAETGASIARHLARLGKTDVSISEPFPFYIFDAPTDIHVTHAPQSGII